jgi:molecular chaperone GrpE (heat shock protein)
MGLDANRMRWVLMGVAIILIVTSVVVGVSYISSPEPQSVSVTVNDAPPVAKPEVAQKSILTSGSVRLPSSSSQDFQTDKAISETASSGGWIIAALVALSVTTLISTVISFYLYRWRRIILSEPQREIVVPEQFHGWINGTNANIEKFTDKLAKGVNYVAQQSQDTNEKVSNLVETFMSLQDGLDERDEEIRRLKRGYDAEIFRKFVSRFIRVDQIVEDLQRAESADANDLENVKRLLEDAFDECGVESFHPELGSDYRKADGVADNPKSEQAENPEDAFKIIEVLECGYQIRNSEGSEVIIPAKVKIYSA